MIYGNTLLYLQQEVVSSKGQVKLAEPDWRTLVQWERNLRECFKKLAINQP